MNPTPNSPRTQDFSSTASRGDDDQPYIWSPPDSLVYLLASVNAEGVQARFSTRTPVRLIGGFMMVMALVLTLKWASAIVGMLG